MNEYIKLHTSFKERLIFLFTGLIKKTYIISKTVGPEAYTKIEGKTVEPEQPETPHKMEYTPFFELDQGETKSNL